MSSTCPSIYEAQQVKTPRKRLRRRPASGGPAVYAPGIRPRRFLALAASLPLLAGCGGKGGGTTIVVKTGGTTQERSTRLGLYRIPSGSMEPTLRLGERVAVETGQPQLGEIVVFHPPEGAIQEICGPTPHLVKVGGAACSEPVPTESNIRFIKRIVAGPGDTIKVIEGHVVRNGAREPDSYIRPCPGVSECNFPVPIKVPAGDWYLMGDNRGLSDDSRFWGPVPAAWIVGVAKHRPNVPNRTGTGQFSRRSLANSPSRAASRTNVES